MFRLADIVKPSAVGVCGLITDRKQIYSFLFRCRKKNQFCNCRLAALRIRKRKFLCYSFIVLMLVAGAMFTVWLGERITENGIGVKKWGNYDEELEDDYRIEYMREHFRERDLTVSTLAELCHVSETYFRRIYHEHFKSSPMQALLEMRFDYAKSLLRSGYYQTKEVAALSGFSDVKYFRTAFKKRFGITPVQYIRGVQP